MHVASDVIRSALVLGILSINLFSQDTADCYPPCRSGYVCHNGECVSLCNPPCPSGQRCNQEGECIPIEKADVQEPITAKTESTLQTRKNIPCSAVFVVRPDMNPQIVPGDYEDGELISAANMIANAVISAMSSSSTATIISNDEIDIVKTCRSRLVIARVKSYHKEPARMGRYQGVVRIAIETYNSVTDKKPARVEEFEAKGGRHWGDSVPLENAFQSVSKHIRRNYGRQVID